MNKRDLKNDFLECREFYYSWLDWESFSQSEKTAFWQSHHARMECMSLSAERYTHVTDAIQENSNMKAVKQSLIQEWSPVFSPTESSDPLSFELLKSFRAESQELVKNRLNYLPCHWIYSGTTYSQRGQLNDIPTTKGPVSIQWDLHLVTEGTGVYEGKGYQLVAPPGSIVLIPPSEVVQYYRSKDSSCWVHQWAAFQMSDSPTALIQQLPRVGGLYHCLTGHEANWEIRRLMSSIGLKNHTDTNLATEQQRQALEQIVALASRETQGDVQVNRKVFQACQYISNNLSKNLNIDDIARQCNLSSSRVSHIFREKLGVSPMIWRNEIRLEKACQLLSYSQYNIGDIAAKVGYEDPLYFSKAFKKRMGFTPSAYRSIQSLRNT